MIIQAGIVLVVFYYSLVTLFLRSSRYAPRTGKGLYRSQVKYIVLFTVFVVLSIIAMLKGLEREYGLRYVIGDTYKFLIPPVCIYYFYLVIRKSAEYEDILYAYYWLAVVMQVLMLVPYMAGILKTNDRIFSVNNLPLVLMLGYFFRERSRRVRPAQWLMLFTIPVYIYFTQSLSLFVSLSVVPLLTIVLYRYSGRRLALFLVGILIFSCTMIYVMLYRGDFIGEILPRKYADYYLSGKFVGLQNAASTEAKLEMIAGSRFAEPKGIVGEISDGKLMTMLVGAGMGSTFTSTSVTGLKRTWTGEDHFVHAGVTESLLRTGVLGAVLYVLISLLFVGVGLQMRRYNIIAALSASKVLTDFLFMIVTTWLGNEFMVFFLVAYLLSLSREQWEVRRAEDVLQPTVGMAI
ncbi:MAG: hypothetical protein OEW15_03095 [Nitrospirota bacterium]|nr:hypothetical protein [Nitrospirota bacterium]